MIDSVISKFSPISLEEMEQVRLMNRIDSKYVGPIDKVIELLSLISSEYFIQEIEGQRNMPYSTTYFDTSDTDMYYQHQRGKKNRQKIRTRLYEGTTDNPFLEIKNKNNKGRTKKKRVKMENGEEMEPYSEFMEKHSNYDWQGLMPILKNHFFRITLVNFSFTERITIDTGIEFTNLSNNNEARLHHIGIIEQKRDGRNCESNLRKRIRELHIRETGFSKYVIGMALTTPEAKQNKLKSKLRFLSKLKERTGPNTLLISGEEELL